MDLRSYLRGLGVGIAVTTIVLAVSFAVSNREPDTEEIIRRAKELGMVETTAFMPSTKESGGQQTEEASKEPSTEESAAENVTEPTAQPLETKESGEAPTEESSAPEPTMESSAEELTEAPTRAPVETMSPTITDSEITVDLRNFTQAYVVAQTLQDVGVVDDGTAFTAYMVEHNYEIRVFEGTYTFAKGLSYEEVARIICRIE